MTNLTITLVQSHLFWDNPVKNRFQLENKLTMGVPLAAVPVRIRKEEHVRVNSGVTLWPCPNFEIFVVEKQAAPRSSQSHVDGKHINKDTLDGYQCSRRCCH